MAAELRSPRHGVAIQAGDTRHQGDATIPLLLGQQGDQLATTMLISPSDQSVDGAMVLCRDAVRMLSAGRGRRSSAVPSWCSPFLLALWCSSPCSLWQEDSSIAILPKPAEVIFCAPTKWSLWTRNLKRSESQETSKATPTSTRPTEVSLTRTILTGHQRVSSCRPIRDPSQLSQVSPRRER